MRKSPEELKKTRLRLLNAGLEIFSRRGFHEATLQEVADAAGYTRGAVYSQFQDKKILFREVILHFHAKSGKKYYNSLTGADSPLVALRKISDLTLETFIKDNEFQALQKILLTDPVTMENDSPFVQVLSEMVRSELRDMEKLFKDAVALKETGPVNTWTAAWSLYSYLTGIQAFWLSDKSLFSLETEFRALTKQFFRSFEC